MKLIKFIFRHFFSIIIIAVIGVIVLTSTAPASSSRVSGIGIDLLSSPPVTAETVEGYLNAIQQSGAQYARIEVNWALIEPVEDVYDWSSVIPYDLFFSSAKARGIQSVAVFTGFPVYFSTYGAELDQSVVGERWEKFVQAAVNRFGEQVDLWQIGDQINTSLSVRSLANADPAFYAKMLISASKIIKRAEASDQVWMGTLVSATSGDCMVNPMSFLLELNGEKAWAAADKITYQPKRGAATPEQASQTESNPVCSSSLPEQYDSLSAEVQSIQDLARQLGGKEIYITGLGWSDVELMALQNGRSIDLASLESDLLIRASTILFGKNAIPVILWEVDPISQPYLMTTLQNLSSTITDAKALETAQIMEGNLQDFRFQRGADVRLIVWRSQDGDAALPVRLQNLAPGKMTAFAADANLLNDEAGIILDVDDSGSTTLMLNERPIILAGKNGGWDEQVKATVADQLDGWRGSIREMISDWVNQQKADILSWVDGLFTQAKDSAVQWGEDKINEIFN